MPNEPVTEAITAFNALIAGVTFPTITDDITDASFNLPAQTGILYEAPSALGIDELTDTTVGGAGYFDKIMTALRNHLKEEFDNGRIQGREYAETYMSLTSAALQNAVQFLVQADSAQYQNALIQMQARGAEADALSARANLVRAKLGVVSALAESENMKAQYALTKQNIGLADIQYTLTETEKDIAAYRLSDILPEEKRKLTSEIDNVMVAQVAKLTFETDNILVKQEDIMDQDIRIKTFQRDNLMVEQEKLLKEQVEVQRAQTLDVRTDNITTIAGAIGKQKELYDEQIASYQKDARYKVAKMFSDAWIAQKAVDDGLLPPDQYVNAEINEVLTSVKTDLSLGT